MIIDPDILSKVKRLHFVGIGGAGMCALAEIMNSKGYQLTGSDNNESDNLSRIRKLGIPVTIGHKAENIGDAELVVHTAAVHSDNVELVYARSKGIPVIERAVLLGLIADKFKDTIAVSGTHGKTTTSCMLTQILLYADFDPTAIIGGKLPLIGGNSRVGKSELMVCEACEFNDSFLHLHPAVSIILNIDNDHLEYFKTIENLIAHFNIFANQTSRAIIYNGDDENTIKALADVKAQKISFGLSDKCDFRAENIKMEPGSHLYFDIVNAGIKIASIKLKIPGRHNVLNALAAAAAAYIAGAPAEAIEKGLNEYSGAGRRFEILGKVNGITIADDYAHHPAELEATLTAAKEMGFKRVWAVFQPFTYSRTAMLMDDFARVLRIPDRVVLAEIMGSREKNTYNVYSKDLAAKIPGSVYLPDFQSIADYILKNASSGDLVITLGCGDIYKAAKLMLHK
ncbi:UDP-N-acetylmuramate-L-alanine ligase [[Clostridium] cellulosi]|uniref:UDP-N-acetylmuramate--L-alanine ligase n=1 Tax=[Clostridium] cellulosi TaxID=29343 RepID=A0A078KNJ7_9FIRM|nr:UDP-N-acetylmuramate-L-alanine ligase [[Clostridium] cellulosi]